MITINGKKMGKSYNNVIKLSELFSGNHEILTQGYSPMTVRFFILQTHYRSTLDFSNEALQAAEKGLKRIWEAFSYFRKIDFSQYNHDAVDKDLDARVGEILNGLESDMNDDLNTAKVMAGLFELVPIINSIKDGKIQATSLSSTSLQLMQVKFNVYLIDIFGLTDESKRDDDKLSAALQLIGEIRRDARSRKDFATSDKIRDQLLAAGIQLKDEKDGGMSWELI
jgi:cysteinyl-tRNA synthetase